MSDRLYLIEITNDGSYVLIMCLIRVWRHMPPNTDHPEESNSLHSHLSKKIDIAKILLCPKREETSTLIRIVSYRLRPVERNCSFKNTVCADKRNISLFCLWRILNI